MSYTSESDDGRYGELRDLLRSCLPLAGKGKNITRRRFFQSAMAAGAAVLIATDRAQAAQAVNCTTQYNICNNSNTCDPNNCTQSNICNGTLTCTVKDTCQKRNTCTSLNDHQQCGAGANSCTTNVCVGTNQCDSNTCNSNQCQKKNE